MNLWTMITMLIVAVPAPLPPQLERFEDHVGGDAPRSERAVGVVTFDRAGAGALDDMVVLYRDGHAEDVSFDGPAVALGRLDTARGLRLGAMTTMLVTGTPAYSWRVPIYRGADTTETWAIQFDAGRDPHPRIVLRGELRER